MPTKYVKADGSPRIAIGIPTFNRPERLMRAIQSAMGQTIPVHVFVADDGDTEEPKKVCERWEGHPNFTYLQSPAKKLWHNWKFVAEAASESGAEFFSWLQDDDLVNEQHARWVVRSFDYYPRATVFLSRLAMAYDSMLGCHWTGNFGPRIPMDLLRGQPTDFPGAVLLPVAYFDAWAMSPAKAFRTGGAFTLMLEALPDDCDMFTERLDTAFMGMYGQAIACPGISGYWIIHGRNESQLTGKTLKDQGKIAYAYLDSLMDEKPGWREELMSWMTCLGNPEMLKPWHKTVSEWADQSPYAAQITEIFEDSMRAYGLKWQDEKEKDKEPAKDAA